MMHLSTHDYISHATCDVDIVSECEKKNFSSLKITFILNSVCIYLYVCLNKFTNRFDITTSHFMRDEKKSSFVNIFMASLKV